MPALDEEQVIATSLNELCSRAEALVTAEVIAGFELIVVDDGSTDGTAAVVADRAGHDPRVHLLTHPRNRGVGAALRTGLEVASGTFLLYTDADLPVDVGEVERALPLLGDGVGLVAGRRSTYATASRLRAWGAHGYDRLARALLGLDVYDVNFPFKLLRTDLARALPLVSEGALVDAELVARVRQAGWRVHQLSMELTERTAGSSKTLRPRLLAQLAVELVRHRAALRDRATQELASP